jgi:predicted ferric reductase
MRQKLYELFLASHVVLSLLFIIGYYYHIWFLYEYKWGYEIWIFIAGGIWGVDRLARLVRMALRGNRTATVTSIQDTDGEYLRIDVEGVLLHDGGVAYLCFPTLGWRFWETHPFSVAFSSDYDVGARRSPASESKDVVVTDKADELGGSGTQSPKSSTVVPISGTGAPTTFFSRVRAGLTSQLAARVAATGSIRLRVFIDGPYPHSGAVTQLSHCSGIVYIAGGVGITALLPYLRQTRPSQPSWLFWAVRKGGLAAAVEPALAALPANVEVETTVGQRLDIDGILESRLTRADSPCGDGPLGIVVCGPPGMADHVRYKAVQLTRNGSAKRPYVLVDEAFGW